MAVFPAFLFIPISAGGTMVVPPIDFARQGPAQVNAAALIQVINDCKVRSFFAAPILIENLAREALARNLTMPSLKRVIGAGAPISGPVEENAERGHGTRRRIGGELRGDRSHAVDRDEQSRTPGRLVGADRAGGRHLRGLRRCRRWN